MVYKQTQRLDIHFDKQAEVTGTETLKGGKENGVAFIITPLECPQTILLTKPLQQPLVFFPFIYFVQLYISFSCNFQFLRYLFYSLPTRTVLGIHS